MDMKAIRIHQYGGPEELKYENAPIPTRTEDQVLVKVYATSVNHLEIKKASGTMKDRMPLDFPWIPGHDFSGVIKNVGENVTGFKEGDKVYGNCNGGSYAEYVVTDTLKLCPMPKNLSFSEAASVPHVAETAWQAIHEHGQLETGQKVLIHGAAGAVGAYAVQFAKLLGATVYASSSFETKEFLEELGIDVFIDYKETDFTTVAKDMDLVLVLVGGDVEKKSYSVLKKGGRLVSTVGISLKGEALKHEVTAIAMIIRQSAEDLLKISDLFNRGKLKTDVQLTYFLENAMTGWDVMLGRDPEWPSLTHGKIVLQVVEEKNPLNASTVPEWSEEDDGKRIEAGKADN